MAATEPADGALEQRNGYIAVYSALLRAWVMADEQPMHPVEAAYRGEILLPDFMQPICIEVLTPTVDWDRRVGDRIRRFLEWGCAW